MTRYFSEKLITTHIEMLNTFDDNATPEIFEQVFGEHIGKHLYDKYIRNCSGSICCLYRYMDETNRFALCGYLNTRGE